MTESRRRRHAETLKSKMALAAMCVEVSTAELAQSYGLHASQVSSWKRQSVEVVRAYFAGKFSRPQRAAADPVLCTKSPVSDTPVASSKREYRSASKHTNMKSPIADGHQCHVAGPELIGRLRHPDGQYVGNAAGAPAAAGAAAGHAYQSPSCTCA